MENLQLKAIVEGLLFVSGDEGITVKEIAQVLEMSNKNVKQIIEQLEEDYDQVDRGMTIMQSNDVYHLTTKREHSFYYKKMLQTPRTSRLSQSALETLAIIAYKQPITRVEIEDIRGVNSDRAVQTLMARSLIEEVGRKDTVGRPILFGTTKQFLTYFGLTSLAELPTLPLQIDADDVKQEADLFLNQLKSENE